MSKTGQNKILYLESLRGLAALSIVLFHFNIDSVISDNAFIRNSWLMVDFFFLLSGFVIALNYQGKLKTAKNVFKFQIRRFFRLYPLHLVMLFGCLGWEFVQLSKEFYTGDIGAEAAFSRNNLTSFLYNLLLTQNLFLNQLTWNSVSWAISAEFYTYLLFALFVFLFAKNLKVFLFISVLISLLCFSVLFNNSMDPSTFGFQRCLYSFFIGVLVFNVTSFTTKKIKSIFSYCIVFISILLIANSARFSSVRIDVFIPLLFGLLIYSLYMSEDSNRLIGLLENKFLIYLGTISYGIYMIHYLFWDVYSTSIQLIFNYPTLNDKLVTGNEMISTCIVVLGIACVIYLAHLSYKIIEMPANKLRKK